MILNDGTTSITFTDQLVWSDEFSWSPVQQSQQYSIGGTLVIQEAKKLSGRPVTLIGGGSVWETKLTIKALHAASLLTYQQFTLTLNDGRALTVMFDKQNNPIEATALFTGQDELDSDQYTINTLRFVEV